MSCSKTREDYIRMEVTFMRKMTGLSANQLLSADVKVDQATLLHYTEVKLDDTPRPKLFMLHGFGGNGAIYYKMFTKLAPVFHIVSVDLPGMGFNSRPKAPFNSTDSCIDFFVVTLKKFLDAIGWSSFSLLGHSMGAFFGTHFFGRFPNMVEKLFIISPAGFSPTTEESKQRWMKRLEEMPFPARTFASYAMKSVFEEKKSPFELGFDWLRNWVFLGFFVKKYFGAERFKFTPEERSHLEEVSKYLFKQPQSGERCLGHCMTYGLSSQRPLLDVLKANAGRIEDVMIVYGISDWMDYASAYRNMRDEGLSVNVYRISDADHQIPFQNPEELSLCVLDFFEKGTRFQPFDYFSN